MVENSLAIRGDLRCSASEEQAVEVKRLCSAGPECQIKELIGKVKLWVLALARTSC